MREGQNQVALGMPAELQSNTSDVNPESLHSDLPSSPLVSSSGKGGLAGCAAAEFVPCPGQ